MKITILVENSKSPSNLALKHEHGLSLHILHNGKCILYDLGASDAFARNASVLGVDVPSVDTAVISHHHFDHGGGFSSFLRLNRDAKIYLGNPPDGKCYFKAFGLRVQEIGLDDSLFEANPDRFVFVNENVEILPGVFVLSKIELSNPKPKGNKYLYLKRDSKWQLDDFSHEIMLVIKDQDGLVLFSGCSHNGILNMMDTVNKAFDGFPIKSIIGGFHLVGLPMFNTMAGRKAEIRELGRKILSNPIERVYTGHCTGQKAYHVLKSEMDAKLSPLHTGMIIEI